MFGFLFPTLPLDTWEKAWIESRMHWLAGQLGIDRLLNADVLLPTDPAFPKSRTWTADEARQVMDLLGDRMQINTSALQLELLDDKQLPGAAGHYDDTEDQHVIRIAESLLNDPEAVVATLAHELSHELLLGGGYLTKEDEDQELVTDLLPVFLGVGVFGANATIRETNVRTGGFYWYMMEKQGYLRSTMLGYAMALFTWVRDDPKPDWARHLRLDAASALRSGTRYLRRTHDSLFQLSTIQHSQESLSINELVRDLSHKSATRRLSALWELERRGEQAAEAAEAIAGRLRDRDRGVRCNAANALAATGPAAEPFVLQLCKSLQDPDFNVRGSAIKALGWLAIAPETVVAELAERLADEAPVVVTEAAAALSQFGGPAQAAIPEILQALRAACIRCDHTNAPVLVWTLDQISGEAESLISEYLVDAHAEYADYALQLLTECREVNAAAASDD